MRFDKAKVWKKVLAELAEEVDFGILSLVQGSTYLDSLEQGIALIGCKNYTIMETLQRKGLYTILEEVFSDVCKVKIQVKFVNGRPRIIEKSRANKKMPSYTTVKPADDSDAAALHAIYGDIMGIVDNHPVFVQSHESILHGGWGIFKEKLTNYCKDYGPDTVLRALREVANDPKIRKPRGYFIDQLEAGRWGGRLAHGASITGPQLLPV